MGGWTIADLRGRGLGKKEGGFEGGWYPIVHYVNKLLHNSDLIDRYLDGTDFLNFFRERSKNVLPF